MKKLVILFMLVSLFVLFGCTDESSSKEALEAQGFTNIEFTGWDAFACSDSDTFSTGFTATNSQGREVSGTVCCGLFFKSCTVRW